MLGEESKKRILILTADVGFGQRSAANAVGAAILEHNNESCQVVVVNPLDDRRTPALLRDTQTDYDKLVKKMPESYAADCILSKSGGLEELRQYAQASRNPGRPQAAYDIAELTWKAAVRGRIKRPFMSAQAIARLRETLNIFGISWESE